MSEKNQKAAVSEREERDASFRFLYARFISLFSACKCATGEAAAQTEGRMGVN